MRTPSGWRQRRQGVPPPAAAAVTVVWRGVLSAAQSPAWVCTYRT